MRNVLVAALLILLSSCSALLPKSDTEVKNRWDSFDSARATFDRIEPYQTSAAELMQLGYDPSQIPL